MGPSTQVAQAQPVQRFWALPGTVRNVVPVDDILVRQCESMLDAIHLCIHLSRKKNYALCDELGIDRGHWTRMMQGAAHFPPNKLQDLMSLCGNFAPLQWLNRAMGVPMNVDPKAEKRARLLRELELLDAGDSQSSSSVVVHRQAVAA